MFWVPWINNWATRSHAGCLSLCLSVCLSVCLYPDNPRHTNATLKQAPAVSNLIWRIFSTQSMPHEIRTKVVVNDEAEMRIFRFASANILNTRNNNHTKTVQKRLSLGDGRKFWRREGWRQEQRFSHCVKMTPAWCFRVDLKEWSVPSWHQPLCSKLTSTSNLCHRRQICDVDGTTVKTINANKWQSWNTQ